MGSHAYNQDQAELTSQNWVLKVIGLAVVLAAAVSLLQWLNL